MFVDTYSQIILSHDKNADCSGKGEGGGGGGVEEEDMWEIYKSLDDEFENNFTISLWKSNERVSLVVCAYITRILLRDARCVDLHENWLISRIMREYLQWYLYFEIYAVKEDNNITLYFNNVLWNDIEEYLHTYTRKIDYRFMLIYDDIDIIRMNKQKKKEDI